MKCLLARRSCQLAGAAAVFAALAIPALAEPQPHMRAALDALQTAEKQLAIAAPDHGGHRVKALAQVRSAIAEVRKGIAFDNRNPPEKR
jgi:hypothetical protein